MKIRTRLRAEDVPPKERFDYWHELIWNSYAPTAWSSDQADHFHVDHEIMELGDVELWQSTFSAARLLRSPKLIRQSDPETCCISIILRGSLVNDTAGNRAVCEVGDIHFNDTSHPSESSFLPSRGQEPFHGIALMVPRALIPLSKIERLVGTRVRAADGIGELVTMFATRLANNPGSYRPADGPRLGMIAADLVSAMLARVLDDDDKLPERSHKTILTRRVKMYIEHNLSDPELTPSRIAAAHHISVSYLHQLFRNEEVTVARWIRHRRLERARHDLSDPTLSAVPIHAIAARCGFPRPADLTRAFRATYGVPPKDCRYRAQSLD